MDKRGVAKEHNFKIQPRKVIPVSEEQSAYNVKPTHLDKEQMKALREAKVAATINDIDIVMIPKNWLDALLSSEQIGWKEAHRINVLRQELDVNYLSSERAWKSEAERTRDEIYRAVEVLKSVEQRLRKPTTDKCECPTCQAVQYIEQFLSSLSQGTDICDKCGSVPEQRNLGGLYCRICKPGYPPLPPKVNERKL